MRKPLPSAALPKIDVMKEGRSWRVDWDYQEAPESRVLFDKANFLDGYVCGLLDALGASAGTICCASARTGTVKKVNEETAKKLGELLKNLLHSHVEGEHRRLAKEAIVLRFQAEGAKRTHEID
jgi:hypothetical protein